MVGFGFMETLVLALLAGGMSDTDLVDVIQPKHYFESRQIRLSIDRMIDIVIAEPKDNKAQVMQLTALRHLADESEAFKKAENYATNRMAIVEIVEGKRGKDQAGFAKEYAQRLLDKLDGKKPAERKLAPFRAGEALAWFPADTTLAGALDMRASGKGDIDPVKELLKRMPEREKLQMYEMVEKVGNVRLERAAFAYSDGDGKNDGRFILRFTGKGSQAGLVEMLQGLDGRGRMQTSKIKADDGTPITLVQDPTSTNAPVFVLVGNTDFLVVAAERRVKNGVAEALAQEVLQVRAKKKANAATGPLKDRLGKVPEKAVGFLVGDVPAEMKRGLARELGDAVPSSVHAYVERTPMGLRVSGEGVLANAADAGKLVQKIGALRNEGIMELKQAMLQPLPAGAPPIPFQGMIDLLEGMQVRNQANKVNVEVNAPAALLQQLPLMMMPRRPDFDKK